MSLLCVEKRQESSSSDGGDAIGGNEDLLTMILRCLPVRSLIRFRSVCKRWCFLISRPTFSLLLPPKSVSGLVLGINSRSHDFNFFLGFRGEHTNSNPFVGNPLDMKILSSCNGLFLCHGGSSELDYYICNPTTNKIIATLPLPEFITLPGGGTGTYAKPFYGMNLLFDPSKLPHFDGMNLAFDPSKSPHCKIILVRSRMSPWRPSPIRFQIQIYSTGTGTWRLTGDPFDAHSSYPSENRFFSQTTYPYFHRGVFVNGIIHWPNIRSNNSIRFDVDKEEICTMPMPLIENDTDFLRRKLGYFGESRGHLQLIMYTNFASGPFHVLEMEGDYSNWFVKYHVDLDCAIMRTLALYSELIWPSPPNPDGNSSEFSVLSIVRREDEDESFMVLYMSGKVVSYNFKTKTLKRLCDLELEHRVHEKDFLDSGYLRVHHYTETLYCV